MSEEDDFLLKRLWPVDMSGLDETAGDGSSDIVAKVHPRISESDFELEQSRRYMNAVADYGSPMVQAERAEDGAVSAVVIYETSQKYSSVIVLTPLGQYEMVATNLINSRAIDFPKVARVFEGLSGEELEVHRHPTERHSFTLKLNGSDYIRGSDGSGSTDTLTVRLSKFDSDYYELRDRVNNSMAQK